MDLKNILLEWTKHSSLRHLYLQQCIDVIRTESRYKTQLATEWTPFYRTNLIRLYVFIISQYTDITDNELNFLVTLSSYYSNKERQGLGEICIYFSNLFLFDFLYTKHLIRLGWNDVYACICPSGSISLHSKIVFDVHPLSKYHTVNKQLYTNDYRMIIQNRLKILEYIFEKKPILSSLLYNTKVRLYGDNKYSTYIYPLTRFVLKRWRLIYWIISLNQYDDEEVLFNEHYKDPNFDYDQYSHLFTYIIANLRRVEKTIRQNSFSIGKTS